MSFQNNKPTEGEPEDRRICKDPTERVLFRTKVVNRPEANASVGGTNGVSGVGGKKGYKGEKRGKMGNTGKVKNRWSHEERKVLWECFERSGGKRSDGYIQKVKAMWDGRDLSVRSVSSLLSQLQQIERNGLLSLLERGEIERMVREENGGGNESSDEEVDFQLEDGDQGCELQVDEGAEEEGVIADSGVANVQVRVERIDVWKMGDEVRQLTGDEQNALSLLREIFSNEVTTEVPSLKTQDGRRISQEVKLVNGLMHNLIRDGMTVTEVNRLLYAGSYVVAARLGMLNKKKAGDKKKPWWQRRLEGNIEEWRKDLSRIDEIVKGSKVREVVRNRLERKYKILQNGTKSVCTMLRNKIKSASNKIRLSVGKSISRRQNNLFKNNQSQLYKELNGKTRNVEPNTPNATEARDFWSGIWGEEKEHDRDASWLSDIKESFSEVERQEDVVVKLEDVKAGIRKLANWKAPGPDWVRGYWLKKLTSVHGAIAGALQECVTSGDVPEWMVKGRTVLIQKDASKGTVPSNYRPITCLPLMWKLLSGIFSEKIYAHLLQHNLLPDEQKGCRKKSRGTKDQLIIDKAILREVKAMKRNLSMCWIDYKKAYDMVPHSWILEML
ncbi:MAG: reverse transcriptase domain-containing protein [Pseudomonadota bacterium]